MGIARANLENLLYLKTHNPEIVRGDILQLGRQDIYFDYDFLEELAGVWSVKLEATPIKHVINPWTKAKVIDDYTLFGALGFSGIHSLDFTDKEKPTIVHNLNEQIPPELNFRWDVVFDGGTLEQVFDVASAFRNIHSMLKPGGSVIHESPTNNYVDHGFWQLCPTLFADTYSTNGYAIIKELVIIFEDVSKLHTGSPSRFDYDQEASFLQNIGVFPQGICSTFFVGRKPPSHMPFKAPIQAFYSRSQSQS
ncbi:MAG: hypothetical protein P4M00_15970 [Azospirillaceae bacterium]|nr:hypothetical protein [Azospirillaceae bacterium]